LASPCSSTPRSRRSSSSPSTRTTSDSWSWPNDLARAPAMIDAMPKVWSSRPSSRSLTGNRVRPTISSSRSRIGSCLARTAPSPTNFLTTGARSKPVTSTSTTIVTTTRSGSSTAWRYWMPC
jgi:hypothetical protein